MLCMVFINVYNIIYIIYFITYTVYHMCFAYIALIPLEMGFEQCNTDGCI